VVLTSNRLYGQAFDAAKLKRQAGPPITSGQLSAVRIVPNPFILESNQALRLGPGDTQRNVIAFYNIPGYCTIKIYTELGELIRTIEHNDGSGDATWNLITSSDQLIVSGVYIAVIEDTRTGGRAIQKFVVIR
ncbi:MAG TPA: hypothetical protein VNL69_06960, partial [Bacteroidota bacterium]|nr:hypothetical protein [Bacteroidota bacterium]